VAAGRAGAQVARSNNASPAKLLRLPPTKKKKNFYATAAGLEQRPVEGRTMKDSSREAGVVQK